LRFSEAFIQKVIEANDIVNIIGQYTHLKPSGSGLMGRCPFPDHPEKTPSFSVSPTRQVYHCFGCHKSGNVITFLKDYNGLSFREAIEYLAERARIELPKESPQPEETYQENQAVKDLLIRANSVAANLFHYQLKTAPPESLVSKYIDTRRISKESIENFQLGFASESWDSLVKALADAKIPPSIGMKAELIRKRQDGSGFYDFFRSRLIFPIQNNLGQVIAFGGRVLDDSQPKYLNSPETPVFQKNKTLYGLYQAAKHIRTQGRAILVEGYMDVIALHQAGLPIAVAPMGTAFTIEQAKILARYTRSIVVLFDGDSAGQNAAIRSLPILFQAGLLPKGLFLPEGLDPDDFIHKFGIRSLISLIDKAPDLFTSLLQIWLVDYQGTATEKVQMTEKLAPIFASIQNDKLKRLYQNEVSWKLGLPEGWWESSKRANPVTRSSFLGKENLEREDLGRPNHETAEGAILNQTNSATTGLEILFDLDSLGLHDRTILQLMLNHATCWKRGWELGVVDLLDPQAKQILQKAEELTRQRQVVFDSLVSLLAAYVKTPGTLFMDSNLQKFYAAEGDEVLIRYLNDLVKKVQDRHLASKIDAIKKQLKTNPQVNNLASSINLFSKLNDLVKLRQLIQKSEVAPLKMD
jgi:DNA primase